MQFKIEHEYGRHMNNSRLMRTIILYLYALIVISLCLWVLLVVIAVGRASAHVPKKGWGAATLNVAKEYWETNHPPLCTTMTVEWNVVPPNFPDREAAATISESSGPCIMWVSPYRIRSLYSLCVTVVHEFGHWIGYADGTDPASINYDQVNESEPPWEPPEVDRCADLQIRFWETKGGIHGMIDWSGEL